MSHNNNILVPNISWAKAKREEYPLRYLLSAHPFDLKRNFKSVYVIFPATDYKCPNQISNSDVFFNWFRKNLIAEKLKEFENNILTT